MIALRQHSVDTLNRVEIRLRAHLQDLVVVWQGAVGRLTSVAVSRLLLVSGLIFKGQPRTVYAFIKKAAVCDPSFLGAHASRAAGESKILDRNQLTDIQRGSSLQPAPIVTEIDEGGGNHCHPPTARGGFKLKPHGVLWRLARVPAFVSSWHDSSG